MIEEILNDSTLSNRQKYQRIFGCDVDRKKALRELDKLRRGIITAPNVVTPSFDKLTLFQNDIKISEKLITCTAEDIKNPNYLLQAHGFDTKHFKIINASSSIWRNGPSDENVCYSSKITVRPIHGIENLKDTIEEFLTNYKCPVITVPSYEPVPSSKVLEICLPDLHFGLEANSLEGAEFFNSTVLYEKMLSVTGSILEQITNMGNNLHSIYITFLGDIMDYDTAKKTTTAGTPRIESGVFEKDYNIALNSLSNLLYSIAQHTKCPINVYYVPGNHDELLGYTIMRTLQAMFSGSTRFLFDITQRSRKVVVIGRNLIGYTHGKMDKNRINQWLYSEAREHISYVDRIEVHAGHIHHEMTEDENGVVVRYLPTIAGKALWEFNKGYNSYRNLLSFEWDLATGLDKINYIKV